MLLLLRRYMYHELALRAKSSMRKVLYGRMTSVFSHERKDIHMTCHIMPQKILQKQHIKANSGETHSNLDTVEAKLPSWTP